VGWANGYYFQGEKPASFGLYTSLSFDLTVTSIFCTLTQGGVLRIYEQTAELSEVLEDSFGEGSGIDSIKLTPSHISYMKHLGLRSGTMHRAIVGGEQVTEEHVRILKEINPGIEIYNEYGPTETTVGCVVAQLSEGMPVVIGRPIAGTRVYVLTEEGELCPVGVAGEICIGGAGVGRGYLHNAELTASKFVADPFCAGGRMYRTGDIGRWQPDGDLVFMGRRDDQVKVRGYRIEPGEIESVLRIHPEVEDVLVLARTVPGGGEKELVAYVIGREALSAAALRSWLSGRVPGYMVPSHFVQVPEWPLTPNGKIDKRRLPEPEGAGTSGVTYVSPRNTIEAQLVSIWEELLGKEGIGITDNFFDAGGNSIRIVKMVAMIEKTIGKKITVATAFRYATIGALAEYLAGSAPLTTKASTQEMDLSVNVMDETFSLLNNELNEER